MEEYGPVRKARVDKESNVLKPIDAAQVESQPFEAIAEGEITAQNLPDAQKDVWAARRKAHTKKITVPEYRVGILKKKWNEMCKPLIEELKLAIKFVPKTRQLLLLPAWVLNKDENVPDSVELRKLESYMTKAIEYIKAVMVGFSVQDALAVLRLEDIFQQSFQISDVKRLEGSNLSRAIGRIAGKDGRTREAIQHSTRTRILLEDKTVHLLGGFDNITLARDAIGSLILGSPPNKVHAHLSVVCRRMKERA